MQRCAPGDKDFAHELVVSAPRPLRLLPTEAAIAAIKRDGVQYVSLKDCHLPMKTTTEEQNVITPYLRRWNLTPDGNPLHTFSSDLLPVRRGETRAMLKIARADEEKLGGQLMVWWEGEGAARVLAHDAATGVLLLERATGSGSLAEMAKNGRDDEATHIICECVQRLHAPRARSLPRLIPLTEWFRELAPAAEKYGGIFARSWETGRYLLAHPQEEVVLHGDVHHGNFLDFGPERGWLAIDPKGLWGECGFDYANLLCNPDRETALAPGRLSRQAAVIAEAAGLDRNRLLQWVLAWAGLSSAWMLSEGNDPGYTVEVAHLAAKALKPFEENVFLS